MIKKFFKKHKVTSLGSLVSVLAITLMLMPQSAHADLGAIGGWIVRNLLWIFYALFIRVMGEIADIGMKLVLWAASFAGFTNVPVVIETWSMVRNFANLTFIIILLVIGFATILKVEAYSFKQLFPKMIIAAVLVNYSRTICGVMVDASQVVMLTFVTAFEDAATAGFWEVFQLKDLVNLGLEDIGDPGNSVNNGSWTELEYLTAVIAAGILITIAAVLMLTFAAVLVARLVFIWTLTILSPLAFATSVLPLTQKYSQQWWDMFGRYVAVGPLIAFFIWLSLFVVTKAGQGGVAQGVEIMENGTSASYTNSNAGKAMDPQIIMNYLIGTMMLFAGLQFSQQMASEVGSITGKLGDMPKSLAKGYWGLLGQGAKTGAWKGTKALSKGVSDRIFQKTGLDLNLARQWELLKGKSESLSKKRVLDGRHKAFEAAKGGAVFRSWLGAADFAYEHYAPIIGSDAGFSKKFGGSVARQIKAGDYERAGHDRDDAIDEINSVEQEMEAEVEKKRGGRITKEEQAEKIDQINAETEQGKAMAAALAGRTIDTSDKTQAAWLASSLDEMQKQQQQNAAEGKKDASTEQLDADISLLARALSSNQKVNLQKAGGTSLAARLDNRLRRRQGELSQEKNDVSGDSNIISNDDLLKIQMEVEQKHGPQLALAAQMKKEAEQRQSENRPIIDNEQSRIKRELMAEASKNIETDNEYELIDQLKNALDTGDAMEFLAVVEHMAKVGHINEAPAAFGFDQTWRGFSDMMKEKCGELNIGEQMRLAVMNDASRSAKQIGHWEFAEGVGSRNGYLEEHDDSTRWMREYVEASKVGFRKIASTNNRLAFGGHVQDQNGNWSWRMNPGMALLAARAMTPAMVKAMHEGRFHVTDNIRENFNQNPSQIRVLEKISVGQGSTDLKGVREFTKQEERSHQISAAEGLRKSARELHLAAKSLTGSK